MLRFRIPSQPAILLLLFALFISAFSPGAAGQPAPIGAVAPSTTFVLASKYDISTLDPALAYDTSSGEVIQNIYETLVFYDGAEPMAFVGRLADTYSLSADGLTWTFHIRPGVTFHNGNPLTASDVAYSFQRGILQGGNNSAQLLLTQPFFGTDVDDITDLVDPTGSLLNDRAALQAWTPGDLLYACQQVQNAIVANDVTGEVTMTLHQKWGPFLGILAGPWGSVMQKNWAVTNGAWNGNCNTWQNHYYQEYDTDPLSAIANGTGPFKLDHWTPGTAVVLTRNNSYWRTPAQLLSVAFRVVFDDATRDAMLFNGTADEIRPLTNTATADTKVGQYCTWNATTSEYGCTTSYPARSLRRYTGQPSNSITHALMNYNIAVPVGGNAYIGTGTLGPTGIPTDFFTDIHIRKAFNYCFDWTAYGTQGFGGAFTQAYTLALEGMPGYSHDPATPHYSFDLTQCENELKLADADHDGINGLTDTDDVYQVGFHLHIPYNTGNSVRQAAAQIWEANFASIGPRFNIDVDSVIWATFVNHQSAGYSPLLLAGWLEDYHDPHNWYEPFLTGSYADRARMPLSLTDQFDPLISQAVSASDFATRHGYYQSLNQLVYDNAALILLGPGHTRSYIQRRVSGEIINPAFMGNYYYTMYKPVQVFYSAGKYDGAILESGENTNAGGSLNATGSTISLGDHALDRQYRGILSFNTASLPEDASITKITLKFKQQSVVGTNPFATHGILYADIRQPYFGAGSGLALHDFSARPNLAIAASFSKTPLRGWYSAVLKSTAYPYINLLGTTQFRLRFSRGDNDDMSADAILFYSGNTGTASYRPTLIVEYYDP